jgi:hypothetical protein
MFGNTTFPTILYMIRTIPASDAPIARAVFCLEKIPGQDDGQASRRPSADYTGLCRTAIWSPKLRPYRSRAISNEAAADGASLLLSLLFR